MVHPWFITGASRGERLSRAADFGTGYSSLGMLGSLPVDTLKIDRSFVQRLTDTPTGKTVVGTIVSLGRAFQMLLGRPGPASEVAEVIARLGSGARAYEGILPEATHASPSLTGRFRRN